jgi:hypothetical protein
VAPGFEDCRGSRRPATHGLSATDRDSTRRIEEGGIPRIKPIAITAEASFVTAEVLKQAFGLEECSCGDRDVAREVSLTDGANHVAIVCWKRILEHPDPCPDGDRLGHVGFELDHPDAAEARARAAGGGPLSRRPRVDLS